MWRLFFARNDAYVDLSETRALKPSVQVAFFKAKPSVSVSIVRFLKAMLQQVENKDLSAGMQKAMRRSNGGRWIPGMMQRLAQYHKIHAFRQNRGIFEIAEPELEIL